MRWIKAIVISGLLVVGSSLLLFAQQGPNQSTSAPLWEVGFSPGSSAENLVLRTINQSQKEIRLATYNLTLESVVEALIFARKRGVDVQVKVDAVHCTGRQADKALRMLSTRKVPVLKIDPTGQGIMHHKFAVVDGEKVLCGSFSWTEDAASKHYEDVVLIRDPNLAQKYLAQWEKIISNPTPEYQEPVSEPITGGYGGGGGGGATQCYGRTQKGTRCKNRTRNPNGYCHVHD